MKLSIIGGGAMGSATALGLLSQNILNPSDIIISTPHPGKDRRLNEAGIKIVSDNAGAIEGADLIILAVKPWILPQAVRDITPMLDCKRQEVCAIVAGIAGADLISMFGDKIPDSLSIAIPNTAMIACESMTFIVQLRGKTPLAENVFNNLGKMRIIQEKNLPGAIALASCGTAFAMRYVRAACEGGVELGFRASEAQDLVVQTLKGVVRLLEQPGSHPETEIDKVTTPGGITIRGLNAMEKAGFTNAVIRGLLAAGTINRL